MNMFLTICFESLCRVVKIIQFGMGILVSKINKFSSRIIHFIIDLFKCLDVIKVSTVPHSIYKIIPIVSGLLLWFYSGQVRGLYPNIGKGFLNQVEDVWMQQAKLQPILH